MKGAECGHPAEPGRKRCRDCRRKGSADRPSRTAKRRHGKRGTPVWKCLSETEWIRLWRFQNGLCGICRAPLRNRYDPADQTARIANVDHDHARERASRNIGVDPQVALRVSVRGLLCYHCNRSVLPALRDRADIARRAADYLESPPAGGKGVFC